MVGQSRLIVGRRLSTAERHVRMDFKAEEWFPSRGLCSERGFEWVVKDKEDRVSFWRELCRLWKISV